MNYIHYGIGTSSRNGYDMESPDFAGYVGFAFISIIIVLIVYFLWEYRIKTNKKK